MTRDCHLKLGNRQPKSNSAKVHWAFGSGRTRGVVRLAELHLYHIAGHVDLRIIFEVFTQTMNETGHEGN